MIVETEYYTRDPQYIVVFNYYYSSYIKVKMRALGYEVKKSRYTDCLIGKWNIKLKTIL